MMDNHTYNLMKQLVQEHKSLWRIKNNYIDDADGCSECADYWTELAKQKEATVAHLTDLVKKHLE